MTRPALPARLRTGDAEQDKRRVDLDRDLRPTLSCPLLAGVRASGLTPDVGQTMSVPHGLGHIPSGALPILTTATRPHVYVDSWTDKTVTVRAESWASVDVPFALWVF